MLTQVTPKVLALIWISVAAALALAGLVTIALAWRGQPSRGRRRCGRCWYDMAAVVGLKCPECGKVAKDERGLFRTRRSRRAMGVGVILLMVAGYVGLATSRMGPNRERWTRWLPTTLLVFIAPVDRSERGHELAQAAWLRSRSMWVWQEAIIARREIAALPEGEVRDALRLRTVWRAGVPMPVRLIPQREFYSICGPRQMDARLIGSASVRLRSSTDSWPGELARAPQRDVVVEPSPPTYEATLPPMEAGRHEFVFEMSLSARGGAKRTLKHTVTVDVLPPDAAVMIPVSSPSIDQAVSDAMRARTWEGSSHGFDMGLSSQAIFDALYRATYVPNSNWVVDPDVAVLMEVLDGDRVLLSRPIEWWGNDRRMIDRVGLLESVAFDRSSETWKSDVLDRLRIRVRGDESLAMQNYDTTRYWSGEVTLPLRKVIEQTPPEGW